MYLVQTLVSSSFLCALVAVMVGVSAAPADADYVDQHCHNECIQNCGETCAGTAGSGKASCIRICGAENTECEASCVMPGDPPPPPPPPLERSVRIAGFAPSINGFHFKNDFNHVSIPSLDINGISMSYGLCGGMSFAVRDYWEEGLLPPVDTITPESGPLWDFVFSRLIDSFADGVVFEYMWLMDPAVLTHETEASLAGWTPHGLAWTTIVQEWPEIKRDLDSGTLSPIGLVLERTFDRTRIGENHQVLAYGYDLVGTDLTIQVYDPNHEDSNDQTISLSIADPKHTTPIYSTDSKYTIHAFIHHSYGWHPSVGGRRR